MQLDEQNITQVFRESCTPTGTTRQTDLLFALVKHLHAFIRETRPSHEEWRAGVDFLKRCGDISDDKRNEFMMMSDILAVSALVDIINDDEEVTASSALGPFYIPGAPYLDYGGDLKRGNSGPHVLFSGRVVNAAGEPVRRAELDIWQTAPNGLYSNQDPEQDPWNLRARMRCLADGEFAFSTVRPVIYPVPMDGPGGEVMRLAGRHPWRASHLHLLVTAPGYRSLSTELFPHDDPYLWSDSAFGVRPNLIVTYRGSQDLAPVPDHFAARGLIRPPFFRIEYDIVLARENAPEGAVA